MHWMDPEQFPVTRGKVDRFLYNPHAEIDGVLLAEGAEVHVPPHLGAQLRKHARQGEVLTLRAAKSTVSGLLLAVSFGGSNGLAVIDEGPKEKKPAHKKPPHRKKPHEKAGQEVEVDGRVVRLLHGAKSEVRGALLEDGTQVRWKGEELDDVGRRLVPGDDITVEGSEVTAGKTRVVHAESLTRCSKRARR